MDFLKIIKNKFFLVGMGVIVITMALFCFEEYPKGRIAVGTKIADIGLGGKTKEQARKILQKEVKKISEKTILIVFKNGKNEQEKTISLKKLNIKYDINKDVDRAFYVGKEKGFFGNLKEKTLSLFGQSNLSLTINVNENNLDEELTKKFGQFEALPQNAQVNFNATKRNFEVKKSKNGLAFPRIKIKNAIEENIKKLKTDKICLSLNKKTNTKDENNCFHLEKEEPEIKTSMAENAKDRANEILKSAPYYLSANGQTKKITIYDIANWLLFVPDKENNKEILTPSLDEELVKNYLAELSEEINIDPENPTLSFENGKIKIVSAPKTGKIINIEKSIKKIQEKILAKDNQISLIIDSKNPEITQEKIKNLKIEKLIGRGTSNFSGSPNNRRYNIKLGASKFNGILIAPEKIFSFNDTLGNVGPKERYLPELVIKDNKTIPEYGGGICQVSTTMFRAAIYSGLEIVERYAHAFPVKYYNPQGFDATVYQPSPDFRFKNNTPGYILVQTKVLNNTLIFEFYGKDDGRRVIVKGPYQYAIKKNGAMKARLIQEVWKKDKLIYKRTFFSSYDSPKKYPVSR